MHLGEKWRAASRYFTAGEAGRLWRRLAAVDSLGHSFQLAALAFMCFFPFLIVVTTAAGRDAAEVLAGWLGLNQQAARAVASLFATARAQDALTVLSVFLLLVGAVAVAGTLQSWYQLLFDVPRRGWRDFVAQLAWLAALLAYGAAQGAVGAAPGGPVLRSLIGFVMATLFWWGSMRVLLAGAVAWRTLFPSALATSVCWTGLGVFSAHFLSAAIVANERTYGPVGVSMAILTWLVAVGVVIHLGAAVGRAYVERHPARATRGNGRRHGGPRRPQD